MTEFLKLLKGPQVLVQFLKITSDVHRGKAENAPKLLQTWVSWGIKIYFKKIGLSEHF